MTATPSHPRFFQPRRFAFWLLVMFVANGAYITGGMVLTGLRIVPVATLVGIGTWTLFALPLLWFFRRLGILHQHGWSGLALAFAWGGLGAIYLALPANQAVFGLCAKLVSPEFCVKWGPALAGPINEESLKLIGVALLMLIVRGRIRSIAAVMALGALTGLGFQIVEDLVYTINEAARYSSPDELVPVLRMFFLRGVISGLWSHAAYTAVAAFGIGWFVARPERPLATRLLVVAAAFAAAWGLHFCWNAPLFVSESTPLPLMLLLLLAKGLLVVLVALALWRFARREAAAAPSPTS